MSHPIEWILSNCAAALVAHEVGHLDTPEGSIAMVDPLVFSGDISSTTFDVPKDGGRIVVFEDPEQGRNSKLVIIFDDADVAGGADVSTMLVDAGLGTILTPTTYDGLEAFRDTLTNGKDPYNDHFSKFDDPQGGEKKIVPLPDGTPIPYIHSGWGDGGYPVFTLTDANGTVIAAYTDFMGCDDDGTYLTPPGVTLQ